MGLGYHPIRQSAHNGNQEVSGSIPLISTIKETSFVYHGKRGFFVVSDN